MNQDNDRLEDIQINRPCPASWDEMKGGEKSRHCEECDLKVHNLAAMSRVEGESLLTDREKGARLCVRMEVHPDGTCITTDNPAPTPEKKQKPGNQVAAALALGAGLLAACTGDKARPEHMDENANLHVEEGPVEHVLQGSIAGEVSENHSTSEAEVPSDEVLQQLMTLGYVDFGDECDGSETETDDASAKDQECESPKPTQGEVAPKRVIMGSPGPRPKDTPAPKPKDK
jgi:hypothetical protein